MLLYSCYSIDGHLTGASASAAGMQACKTRSSSDSQCLSMLQSHSATQCVASFSISQACCILACLCCCALALKLSVMSQQVLSMEKKRYSCLGQQVWPQLQSQGRPHSYPLPAPPQPQGPDPAPVRGPCLQGRAPLSTCQLWFSLQCSSQVSLLLLMQGSHFCINSLELVWLLTNIGVVTAGSSSAAKAMW